jgi:Response regulator containing CheY-like receiver, AAA-type ATPase, and DNA-binding domains
MTGTKTIFLVEDDPDILVLYRIMMERKPGYSILDTATNGQEAIEKYKRFDTKPDLIIMDHRMPVKSGIEATKEILEADGNVRILFVSADVSVREEALEIGAVGFLEKPSSMDILLDGVEKALH